MSQVLLDERAEQSLKDAALLAYILILVSLFTALPTGLAGVVVAYVKRGEAGGSWVASHFDKQIQVFWKAVICMAVSGALFCTIIGIPFAVVLSVGTWIWVLVQMVHGIRDLRDHKEAR